MARALPICLLPLIAALACGDVKYTQYYEGAVDSDVGQDDGDGLDAGASEQPTGDPCGDESPWSCDPVTNAGCPDGGVGCDFGEHGGVLGFFCFTDATEPVGATCAADGGPWCAGGATCADGICRGFCCGDDDCDTGACEPVTWEPVEGPLGLCAAD